MKWWRSQLPPDHILVWLNVSAVLSLTLVSNPQPYLEFTENAIWGFRCCCTAHTIYWLGHCVSHLTLNFFSASLGNRRNESTPPGNKTRLLVHRIMSPKLLSNKKHTASQQSMHSLPEHFLQSSLLQKSILSNPRGFSKQVNRPSLFNSVMG